MTNQALLSTVRTAPLAISGFQFLNDVVVPHQVAPFFLKKHVYGTDLKKSENWMDVIRTAVLVLFHANDGTPNPALSPNLVSKLPAIAKKLPPLLRAIANSWDTVHTAYELKKHPANWRAFIPELSQAYQSLADVVNPARQELQKVFSKEDWTTFLRNVPRTTTKKRFPHFNDKSIPDAGDGSGQGRDTVLELYTSLFLPQLAHTSITSVIPQPFMDVTSDPMTTDVGLAFIRHGGKAKDLPDVKVRSFLVYTLDVNNSMLELNEYALKRDCEALSIALTALQDEAKADRKAQIKALVVNAAAAEKLYDTLTPEQLDQYKALLRVIAQPKKAASKSATRATSRKA